MTIEPSRVSAEEFERLVRETIPMSEHYPWSVESVQAGRCVLRMRFEPKLVRAGGTISGPTLMTLADTALYLAVLSRIGLEAMAVTSDLHIRFLRRPPPADLLAEARVLRLGRKLAITEVVIASDGHGPDPVAHVTASYALP